MRILLVDDDAMTRNVVSKKLTMLGNNVIECENGAEATKIIETGLMDVIISDYQMPEMDGAELHKWVRSHNELKRIPFIFVSGMDRSKIPDSVKNNGVTFIEKDARFMDNLVSIIAKIRPVAELNRELRRMKISSISLQYNMNAMLHRGMAVPA